MAELDVNRYHADFDGPWWWLFYQLFQISKSSPPATVRWEGHGEESRIAYSLSSVDHSGFLGIAAISEGPGRPVRTVPGVLESRHASYVGHYHVYVSQVYKIDIL